MGSYSTGHGSYSGRSSHGGHGDCCCCGGDDGLLGGSAALAAAAGAALGLLIAAAIKAKAVRRRRREIGFPAMASSVDLSRELFFTGRWDFIILFFCKKLRLVNILWCVVCTNNLWFSFNNDEFTYINVEIVLKMNTSMKKL